MIDLDPSHNDGQPNSGPATDPAPQTETEDLASPGGLFERGGGARYMLGSLRSLLLSVGIAIAGTVAVYFALKPQFGRSSVVPLVAALCFPILANLVSIIRRRRFDIFGILVMIGLVGTIAFGLLGGGQRVLLLRETLLTGVIGAACLLSLPLPRPAGYYFARQLITGNDPDKLPGFYRLWENPLFRCTVRKLNVFWALVLLGEFALQAFMVVTLPVAVVLATGTIVVAVPRVAALIVTVAVGRRVSLRMRNETASAAQ